MLTLFVLSANNFSLQLTFPAYNLAKDKLLSHVKVSYPACQLLLKLEPFLNRWFSCPPISLQSPKGLLIERRDFRAAFSILSNV